MAANRIGPNEMDATFFRGKVNPEVSKSMTLNSEMDLVERWPVRSSRSRRKTNLAKAIRLAEGFGLSGAVVTCDNKFTLYLNGKKMRVATTGIAYGGSTDRLVAGKNELMVVAENQGDRPNPAGLFFEAKVWAESESPD